MNDADAASTVFRIESPDRAVTLAWGQSLQIGRAPSNDLVLTDPTVSRHHARLEWTQRHGPEVVDLASANGTFVDGVAVTHRAPLEERCLLGVGNVTLQVMLSHPALIPSQGPLLCRLVGERGPELDGVLPGPSQLQALLLDLAQARRTGTLWLEHEGVNVLSRVTLALGTIVDARSAFGRGLTALRHILLRPGAVRYMLRVEVEPCEEPLSISAREAIADACQTGTPPVTRPMRRVA